MHLIYDGLTVESRRITMSAKLLKGAELATMFDNLIYAKKQVHEWGLDITIKKLFQLSESGALDFGGTEWHSARKDILRAMKRTQGEKYGWWDLGEGTYLFEYNEKYVGQKNIAVFVQPHERLRALGASHSSFYVFEDFNRLLVPMHVGRQGIRIKENARISSIVVFEDMF